MKLSNIYNQVKNYYYSGLDNGTYCTKHLNEFDYPDWLKERIALKLYNRTMLTSYVEHELKNTELAKVVNGCHSVSKDCHHFLEPFCIAKRSEDLIEERLQDIIEMKSKYNLITKHLVIAIHNVSGNRLAAIQEQLMLLFDKLNNYVASDESIENTRQIRKQCKNLKGKSLKDFKQSDKYVTVINSIEFKIIKAQSAFKWLDVNFELGRDNDIEQSKVYRPHLHNIVLTSSSNNNLFYVSNKEWEDVVSYLIPLQDKELVSAVFKPIKNQKELPEIEQDRLLLSYAHKGAVTKFTYGYDDLAIFFSDERFQNLAHNKLYVNIEKNVNQKKEKRAKEKNCPDEKKTDSSQKESDNIDKKDESSSTNDNVKAAENQSASTTIIYEGEPEMMNKIYEMVENINTNVNFLIEENKKLIDENKKLKARIDEIEKVANNANAKADVKNAFIDFNKQMDKLESKIKSKPAAKKKQAAKKIETKTPLIEDNTNKVNSPTIEAIEPVKKQSDAKYGHIEEIKEDTTIAAAAIIEDKLNMEVDDKVSEDEKTQTEIKKEDEETETKEKVTNVDKPYVVKPTYVHYEQMDYHCKIEPCGENNLGAVITFRKEYPAPEKEIDSAVTCAAELEQELDNVQDEIAIVDSMNVNILIFNDLDRHKERVFDFNDMFWFSNEYRNTGYIEKAPYDINDIHKYGLNNLSFIVIADENSKVMKVLLSDTKGKDLNKCKWVSIADQINILKQSKVNPNLIVNKIINTVTLPDLPYAAGLSVSYNESKGIKSPIAK